VLEYDYNETPQWGEYPCPHALPIRPSIFPNLALALHPVPPAQQLDAENYLGHNDWRLPNAKELQSLVDYSRVPAIAPVFDISRLPDGEYPFYWSSTTHLDGPLDRQGGAAVYVCFGRALGWMQFPPGWGDYHLLDVHGAGAQRSDPKAGDASLFPRGRGPQGDVIRINNWFRCVRDGNN